MLVQAQDGMFYLNPVIVGEDWFLNFRDTDPEIIVKKFANTTEKSGKTRARQALGKMGKVLELSMDQKRSFPPGWDKLFESVGYYVKILEPIPIPLIHDQVVNYPSSEEPFLAWSLEFETSEVLKLFTRDAVVSKFLLAFLFNETIYDSELENYKQKARNWIRKSYP